jgi:hypothetical protein
MDEEVRLSFKSSFHQSNINLISIPAVSDHGKLEWRFNRFEPLNILADLSDRSCIRRKGDEKNDPEEGAEVSSIFLS